MKTAAFFDLDRTLVRCNSGTLWVKWMRQRGEITRWGQLRALGWIAQYKLALIDMESVVTRVIAEMKGDDEGELREKCLEFTRTQVLDHVTPQAPAALERHRKDDHVIAILSTGSPYVTEPVAKHLGIEHVLCTRFGVAGGKL